MGNKKEINEETKLSEGEKLWRMLVVLGAVLATASISLNLRTLFYTWF